jgi:hypothetical protein
MKNWEKNYLGIYDTNKIGKNFFYINFIKSKKCQKLNGDIVESGVFKGQAFLATALILKEIGSKKKIWGYDSFKGFPKFSSKDRFSIFKELKKKKIISHKHYEEIKNLNKHYKILYNKKNVISNISTSNNFSDTNLGLLKKKIDYLKLKKYTKLVVGNFQQTMKLKKNIPKKISAGLIDCDLYESYKLSLENFWPCLLKGGKLFLDEYYSLKFPGARIFVNEFVKKTKDCKIILEGHTDNFERWSLEKI